MLVVDLAKNLGLDEKEREGLASFLRRLLNDLEAGKNVRVALDLKALINELEYVKEVPSPSSHGEKLGPSLIAESVWV